MPYAQSYRSSRGGIFSTLGRAVGKVAGVAARVGTTLGIPGAPAAARAVQSVMPGGRPLTQSAGPVMSRTSPGQAFLSVNRGVSASAAAGGGGRRYRKMNAGNAKAARRAIRRIKSVRHLLQSIERELPRRPAARSHGVITRAEAARALRT